MLCTNWFHHSWLCTLHCLYTALLYRALLCSPLLYIALLYRALMCSPLYIAFFTTASRLLPALRRYDAVHAYTPSFRNIGSTISSVCPHSFASQTRAIEQRGVSVYNAQVLSGYRLDISNVASSEFQSSRVAFSTLRHTPQMGRHASCGDAPTTQTKTWVCGRGTRQDCAAPQCAYE